MLILFSSGQAKTLKAKLGPEADTKITTHPPTHTPTQTFRPVLGHIGSPNLGYWVILGPKEDSSR
jgi:hypothetical protein